MAQHHGMRSLAGQANYCSPHHKQSRVDRFGRLFPDLPAAYVPADVLQFIGKKGRKLDGGSKSHRTKSVPVGHVFFGQFIDHDITLDISSSFDRVNDPSDIRNVRTPTLDLDCVYGSGPEPHPFLFHDSGTFRGAKLLTGADEAGATPLVKEDLLRAPKAGGGGRGPALIGDPRNDENRIISQLQLGMIRFHNLMCDSLNSDLGLEGHELYLAARERTMWHYQWAVVNDFLVTLCGKAVVDDILSCGRTIYCGSSPFIPVEFSVAAYRFGHSMAPMKINVQKGRGSFELFGSKLGKGFSPVTSKDAVVDWKELFASGSMASVQKAEKLDTKLAADLLDLPFISEGESSLATRNLLRGNAFLLPGGDKVAAEIGRPDAEVDAVIKKVRTVSANKISNGVPLWLYVLAEAEVIGRETTQGSFDKGEGLGPVGARIVAETILGLLELDESSYLGANRNWVPDADFDTIGKMLIATLV